MANQIPSKLLKLKEWLTLPEAVKYLSGVCCEDVMEADILRLALDGYLTLSVNFINHAYARPGKIVHFDETELFNLLQQDIYPSELKWADALFDNEKLLLNKKIGEGKFLNTEDKVVEIQGVWDLPMIGGERIDIEDMYHQKTDGNSVELIDIDGAFVARDNGKIYQLQESFGDRYGYHAAIMAQISKLNRLKSNKTSNRRKEMLLNLRMDKLEQLKKAKAEWNSYNRYYPAWHLPEDCVLVVRTEALKKFGQLISENESERNERPRQAELSETQRKKMLLLIIGMAIDAYGYDPKSNKNSATGDNKYSISAKLKNHGIEISDDTIRNYLKEAKDLL